MDMYYENIQQLIGKTPLVKLEHVGVPEKVQLFAKLEYWNPSGSVKDRIGLYMLQDAEGKGVLLPGGTIVEATAGNTGLGIAIAALNKGYEIIFVVPTKFSQEKQALLKALGAKIINTPKEKGMLGADEKAAELVKEIPGAISLKQFENPTNPLAHYETTGKEIYDDLEGKLDFFIAGAGSGGTYSGVVKYLKEKNPKIKGILADPIGSTMGGGEYADYDIEGIGNDFIPATMDMELVDDVIKISDTEAFEGARLLVRKEGMIVGSSSGAAIAGAVKLADKIGEGTIVTLFPDRGDRYFSKNLY